MDPNDDFGRDRSGGTEPTDEGTAPIIPAATVVIVRDAQPDERGHSLEVLMLRRNSKLEFAGGMWVFPGGRVDDEDREDLPVEDEEGAARRAAVREASEEAGVELESESLVWFSHWTPPSSTPKRFGTYFFAAPAPPGELVVTVDGGEIHDHSWFRPTEAMLRRNQLEIELAPPTWITLEELARHPSAEQVLDALRSKPPEYFATHVTKTRDSWIVCYHGDVAYDGDDPDLPGGRHRLVMADEGWHYERDGWR